MHRLACGIEYDGSRYYGWQRLRGHPSIQQAIEQALSAVADHAVTCKVAGRTDTGVHATGQVIHFDTDAVRNQSAWLQGSNRYLPDDISLHWVQPVTDEFHARHSARRRCYRYLILNAPSRSALLATRAICIHTPLDIAAMQTAAKSLTGEHDFSSFRSGRCRAHHPVRTLHHLQVIERKPFVSLEVEANGFLHHMVRILAGTLIEVGTHKQPVDWPAQLLADRNRTAAGSTAAACGLYLTRIHYPSPYNIPSPLWVPDYSAGFS